MEPFETVKLDLSMRDVETGKVVQANMYRVDGIDRDLSIGQLVMAICLNRATDMESRIVSIMQDMTNTSAVLDILSSLEEKMLESIEKGLYLKTKFTDIDMSGDLIPLKDDGTPYENWDEWLSAKFEIDVGSSERQSDGSMAQSPAHLQDASKKMESKMDELNSFSQEKMIELQSYTNKRDQAYDMVSNITKTLSNVMIGIVNNC